MSDYHCVRLWRVRPEAVAAHVEALASSSIVEIQRWIPGIKRLSLLRLQSGMKQYLMTTTFVNYEAYIYWRQVEVEAPDYWERYAAVMMQWEHLCELIEEYVGELVVDAEIDDGIHAR